MTILLYHLYSGHLFFTASALFLVVVTLDLCAFFDQRPVARRVAGFMCVLSIPLAALSGTPMPLLLALSALSMAALYAFAGFGASRRFRFPAGLAAIALLSSTVVNELRYHAIHQTIPVPSRIFVIGDSLSAGGFGETLTWPVILSRRLAVPVSNLALSSDKAEGALRNQVTRLPLPMSGGECVIIEIGGNDMIDGEPVDRFESALDAVLRAARAGGRRNAVMLELPLLPGAWRYGMAQRRLAARHGVVLVPKRVLAGVLLDRTSTSDGLHLVQRGHGLLAAKLMEWLRWEG